MYIERERKRERERERAQCHPSVFSQSSALNRSI